MITAIRPYTPQNTQRQNFCAVNPEFFKRAQEAVEDKIGYNYVTRDLNEAFVGEDLSRQDTLDTLQAIKEIYPPNFKKLAEAIITRITQ